MIIPAILEESVVEVQKKVDLVRNFVSRVQIDIIDADQTVSLKGLRDINFYHLAVDIHLMTDAPEKFLSLCMNIAKNVNSVRVIGQIERMADQRIFIQKVNGFGLESGLAVDLYTPISSLDFFARDRTNCILLMSVKAGFSGQHFDSHVVEKIRELKDSPYKGVIMMDGGEDPLHIKMSREAGAAAFAVGNFLWHHEDVQKALKTLQNAER